MNNLKIIILGFCFLLFVFSCKSDEEKRAEKICKKLENPHLRHFGSKNNIYTQSQQIIVYTPDSIDYWADPNINYQLNQYLEYMNSYETEKNRNSYYSDPNNIEYGRGGDYYATARKAENMAHQSLKRAEEYEPMIKAALQSSTFIYDDSYVYVFEVFNYKEYIYPGIFEGPYTKKFIYKFSKDGELIDGPHGVLGTTSPFEKINSLVEHRYSSALIK